MERRECAHEPGETFWYLQATQETGWRCTCGHEWGYRPDLDRDLVSVKVDGILHDLHDMDVLYMSNSDHGHHVARDVARRCEREGRYDQRSIVAFLLGHPDVDNHRFWQEKARQWFLVPVTERRSPPPHGQMPLDLGATG